jgi:hypothetical protein
MASIRGRICTLSFVMKSWDHDEYDVPFIEKRKLTFIAGSPRLLCTNFVSCSGKLWDWPITWWHSGVWGTGSVMFHEQSLAWILRMWAFRCSMDAGCDVYSFCYARRTRTSRETIRLKGGAHEEMLRPCYEVLGFLCRKVWMLRGQDNRSWTMKYARLRRSKVKTKVQR